jgi:hypothetical protein
MVVRWPHAHGDEHLGRVFVVGGVGDMTHCQKCQKLWIEPVAYVVHQAVPMSWLKRIPPLEELEGQKTEEKLHA